MPLTLPLRALAASDAGALVRLAESVGWKDSIEEWHTAFTTGVGFGHRDDNGDLISSGMIFDFGSVYSIGKMIVHPAHRGKGLARAVLERLLSQRRPSTHTSLVATSLGRPVYEKLGFVKVAHVHKLIAQTPTCAPLQMPRGAQAASLETLLANDAAVFGADRRTLFNARIKHAQACLSYEDAVGLRVIGKTSHIGPVYARDERHACALLRELIEAAPGPCRVDVTEQHPNLVKWLCASGFVEVETPSVMTERGGQAPGKREELYALATLAYG